MNKIKTLDKETGNTELNVGMQGGAGLLMCELWGAVTEVMKNILEKLPKDLRGEALYHMQDMAETSFSMVEDKLGIDLEAVEEEMEEHAKIHEMADALESKLPKEVVEAAKNAAKEIFEMMKKSKEKENGDND